MNEFGKIVYYDLIWEAVKGRLLGVVGRIDEQARLSRVVNRRLLNNCLVVGPSGIGKTALLHAWVKNLAAHDKKKLCAVELEPESFYPLTAPGPVFSRFEEALSSLPPCVLVLDNFGSLVYNKLQLLQNLTLLLKPLFASPKIKVILTCEPEELRWITESDPGFGKWFEILNLKNQSAAEVFEILKEFLQALATSPDCEVSEAALKLMVELGDRFTSLGQQPKSSISILDESLAQARAAGLRRLDDNTVLKVVADKIGVPLAQLAASETELLKDIGIRLNSRIIGQSAAVSILTSAVQRAKLGLKNQERPLGSFLLLGPSGVGKTETGKVLAELVFGQKDSFVRLDMSEFGEAHTAQRLTGAPPGYLGHDAGGYLTNWVKNEPHSLILLDEIEKAHPSVFDIFLQILDDGRLTSGRGETVDFTQTLILATSNLAVAEILKGYEDRQDITGPDFLRERILPVLTQKFRLEFLNRFEDIVVFKPLVEEELWRIALLEIKKIEERSVRHRVKFEINPEVLRRTVASLADTRFGARPVKRFVEETCESLIAEKLLI